MLGGGFTTSPQTNMAASSAQVVVKVTFGDETILKQSPQLCVQLLLNEAPLTADLELTRALSSAEKVHFQLRLAPQLAAAQESECKSHNKVQVVKVPERFRSHFLKANEPVPESMRKSIASLPPVITEQSSSSSAVDAASDEWVLLDDEDDDEQKVSTSSAAVKGTSTIPLVQHASAYAEVLKSTVPEPPASVSAGARGTLSFYLNGQLHTPDLTALPVDLTLAHYLREVASLTGTKIGCGEGGCGACTVLLSYKNAADGSNVSVPINSCLRPLLAVDGMSVTTIEGIGSSQTGYHPVQERLAQNAGTQCGYCSPGFSMNAYALLVNAPNGKPTAAQVENQFSGHICRCTGYRPILEAFRSFCATDSESTMTCGSNGCSSALTDKSNRQKSACCKSKGISSCLDCTDACSPSAQLKLKAAVSAATSDDSKESSAADFKAKHTVAAAVRAWNAPESQAVPDMEDLLLPFALRRSGQKAWAPHPAPAPKPSPASSSSSLPSCISSSATTFEQYWLQRTTQELDHLEQLRSNTVSKAPKAQDRPRADAKKPLPSSSSAAVAAASNTEAKQVAVRPLVHASATGAQVWTQPLTLTDAYAVLTTYAGQPVRLTVGNTSTGVIKYYPAIPSDTPAVFIDISRIPDLNKVTVDAVGLHFGAAVSIATVMNQLQQAIAIYPAAQTAGFPSLLRHLTMVGNVQVRSAGSWAGNISIAKQHPLFPSDLVTMFSAYGAQIDWTSGSRGLKSLDVLSSLTYQPAADEFMMTLHVPFTAIGQLFESFKIAQRHQNAHPLLNAGFSLRVDANNIVQDGALVFGGLQVGPRSCTQTLAALKGKPLSAQLLQAVLPVLNQECTPSADPPPPGVIVESAAYRQSCAVTFFYRYAVAHWFPLGSIPPPLLSLMQPYQRPISSGVQAFTSDPNEQPVSLPIPKISGILQTSGEAKYSGDQPLQPGALYASFATSTQPAGKLLSIDASAALALPGVAAFYSAKDVLAAGGQNSCGMFPGDEELFASTEVGYVGQPIGLIVAESPALAEQAAKLVTAQYDTTGYQPILTIDQAIAANSFLVDNQYVTHIPSIVSGDVDKGFAQSQVVLEGTLYTGAQTIFYMETQTAVVQIEENDVYKVYSSTQGAADTRATVATVLGVPSHKVIVEGGRMGGGFGGKLFRGRPIAAAAALATKLSRRQVRMQMSRTEDMHTVGKRHPYECKFKVGVNKDGSFQALQMQLYLNGGFAYDTALGTSDMAQLWADNCYFFPNWKSEGYCCKTNMPPFTAMRTPGVLNSVTMLEEIIERVAFAIGMPSKAVREKNFYQQGQVTPYGQPIDYCNLQTVWANLLTQSDYNNRWIAVQKFNAMNRWYKRGLSLVPIKYGFTLPGQMQSAMVQILAEDGTVVLSHSGAEVGQGLTTKVMQCVSYALGVPLSMIVCRPTSTDKIPNFTVTGGSSTSESVCQAAMDACAQLNTILAKYRGTGKTWAEIVGAAWGNNESLTATSIFNPARTPYPFAYYVWCAACTEVQIDVLSGETHIIRTDISYDAGQSLNPIVDIGQIEGAFVQGIGFFMTEQCIFDATTGRMINTGTWDYKPPASLDIPIDFRVTLLPNLPNPVGIMRSKGSGEPPYCLAASVKFAVENAVAAARTDIGQTDMVELPVPASVATIQQACGVDISQLVVQ